MGWRAAQGRSGRLPAAGFGGSWARGGRWRGRVATRVAPSPVEAHPLRPARLGERLAEGSARVRGVSARSAGNAARRGL